MPNTIGQHAVATFTSPVNGTTPIDANSVRGNDNTLRSSYNNHDADPGVHLQSSALASRPVAGTAGRKWMTTDSSSYRVWYDDGTNWQELTYLSGGGGTITGNLLITGTLGVTGVITATGGVSGNVTGNLTGNASTATALQTARAINGVNFDGTAAITVTAAAGTLSGSTLAAGVTASSLTSVGTLTALTVSGNLAVDTNTLFVDAANNAVGIGTTSPAYKLDVTTTTNAVGIATSVAYGAVGEVYSAYRFHNTSFSGGNSEIRNVVNGATSLGSALRFLTSQNGTGVLTERATLDNSGNLGLGVTPSAWATANGQKAIQITSLTALWTGASGAASLGFNAYESGANAYTYTTTNPASAYQQDGAHKWLTAPSGTAGAAISFTQAMTLDASGNLGIGTSSPVSTLHVRAGTDANMIVRLASAVIGGATGVALSAINNAATAEVNALYQGNIHQFVTASTERARVKSTGQVRFVPLSADPAGAETGDVYYNSSTNKLRVYNGAWVDLH